MAHASVACAHMLRNNETSRVGAVLEHARAGDRAAMIKAAVELWVTMYDLRRDDPKVFEVCKAMAKTRPSELPWLKPAWDRLVKERTSWTTRIKLALF